MKALVLILPMALMMTARVEYKHENGVLINNNHQFKKLK